MSETLLAWAPDMLAALQAAEAAADHWFNDGPGGCEECDRNAGEPCEVQIELQEKADALREAVLAEIRTAGVAI